MAGEPLKIILVGKTGCGKSTTGNFIVGYEAFKPSVGFISGTTKISHAEIVEDGRKIIVVDTPGLFDTNEDVFETALKIETSLKEVSAGPHAFLIVIDGSQRYTEEAKDIELILQIAFGKKIFEHALIIFTHEDKFKSSDELLRQAESLPALKTLIESCGRRCITLNNCTDNRDYKTEKIKKIINEIKAISKNGEDCYSEDLTACTQTLKELAIKKTANKDLTSGLLHTVLKNANDNAKRQAEAAYKKGKEEGNTSGMASEIATGLGFGAFAVGGTVALGAIGLAGYMITKDTKILEMALKAGIGIHKGIAEAKRKRDNQDIDRLHIDQSLEESVLSLNKK